MNKEIDGKVRTVTEIGELVKQLDLNDQLHILNTINSILFAQEKNNQIPQKNGCSSQEKDT